MREKIIDIIKESVEVKKALLSENGLAQIEAAARAVISAVKNGRKVLIFGNGGSAADSQHIAAEFVGRFQKERRPLPAIALTADTSNLTAISNDYGYEASFSRQLEALGKKGDVAIGISTSGNSKNVLRAVEKAHSLGLVTIGLCGGRGGKLARLVDVAIVVPSGVTARVQEGHITIGHIICQLAEEALS